MIDSEEADVISGLDSQRRLYRQHVATGEIDVVPIDPDELEWRVVLINDRGVVSVIATDDSAPETC